MSKKLVGCISHIKSFGAIKTRYFYVDSDTNTVKDVTLELCNVIEKFNENNREIRLTGKYALIIPYQYKNGLAEYSHGCGLSHYLQEELFKELSELDQLSFPLELCSISMFVPSDVKHILGCSGVFSSAIVRSLEDRFFKDNMVLS